MKATSESFVFLVFKNILGIILLVWAFPYFFMSCTQGPIAPVIVTDVSEPLFSVFNSLSL